LHGVHIGPASTSSLHNHGRESTGENTDISSGLFCFFRPCLTGIFDTDTDFDWYDKTCLAS